jgi:hypothetical protein
VLHDLIDAYVAIANKHRNHVSGRHVLLVRELGELLLQRIIANGCTLPQEKIYDLLSMDVDLNARGLESWLELPSKQ